MPSVAPTCADYSCAQDLLDHRQMTSAESARVKATGRDQASVLTGANSEQASTRGHHVGEMSNVSKTARRKRQRAEILDLAACGLRRAEIAEALGVSERTVQRVTSTAAPEEYPVPERLQTAKARVLWRSMMAAKARRRDGAIDRYVEPRLARIAARAATGTASSPAAPDVATRAQDGTP